jgi:transcriptional regulator with XRE-family HTH domain
MKKLKRSTASLHLHWVETPTNPQIRNRYAKQIARRLIATRTALGLSQADLCRLSGVKQSAYNQYEKAVNIIGLKGAFRICACLGVSLDWLYFGSPTVGKASR